MGKVSRLLLGTQNNGKLKEMRAFLGTRCEVVGLSDLGRDIPEVPENENTYYEHALKKAVSYQRLMGIPCVADDSGLEIDALGGAPGVHSATFGGVGLEWPQRWAHVLKQLKAFPPNRWTARFRCVLCFYDGKAAPLFFEGITEGRILPEPVGDRGFGYDPIVFSNELGTAFAQASIADKNRVSHRAKALKLFADWLDQSGSRG